MAEELFTQRFSDMDPYDQEERCRKAIRTLDKAIAMRIAAGILLLVAVIRSGAVPVAVGLSGFLLLILLAGTVPLVRELKKQNSLRAESLKRQEEQENQKKRP